MSTDIAIKLAKFIEDNHALARTWPEGRLVGWLRWHLGEQFVGYVIDGAEIVGVGIARPVMHPEDGRDDYAFDQDGPCLFVDLAISCRPGALPLLVVIMRRRFGLRDQVAFMRCQDRIVTHSFRRFHARTFAHAVRFKSA